MGRRPVDSGWEFFEDELRAFTAAEIARHLNKPGLMLGHVDDDVARRWKAGSLRPRFSELPVISRGLFDDSMWLAQCMGMIPSDETLSTTVFNLQRQVDRLTRQRDELDVSVSESRNQSVGRIVTAAANTGRWAVGVWPAVEGIDGYKFHANDRLDFVRTDGRPGSRAEIERELELMDLLHTAHAVPLLDSSSARPRFADLLAEPAAVSYSIPWLYSQFPPSTSHPIGTPASIAVVSATTRSWARDTAGFMARILGYGLMHTRSIDIQTHGYSVSVDERRRHNKRMLDSHERILIESPKQYVWSHVGAGDPERLFLKPQLESRDDSAVVVWIRESDELLDQLVPGHADQYKKANDEIEEHAVGREKVIILEADLPAYAVDGNDPSGWRGRMMLAALTNADSAIAEIVRRGLLSVVDVELAVGALNHDTRSSLARETHRWLKNTGRLARGWA